MALMNNRWGKWWILLIGLGCLVRLASVFQFNPLESRFSDSERHWLNGERLFVFDHDLMSAGDPIGYQVFMFLLRSLLYEEERMMWAVACGALSLLMPWTFYRAARELGFDRTRSLAVWAAITWMPSLLAIYRHFMTETLLLPLMGVGLWMSARHLRKGTLGAFLLAVFCWGLACLTKPIVVPLAGICLAYTWWFRSRKVLPVVAALSLAVVMVLPSTARTQCFLGFAAPLGNPWLVMIQHRGGNRTIQIEWGSSVWEFGSPSCYYPPFAPLSDWMIRRGRGEETFTRIQIDPALGEAEWRRAFAELDVGAAEWWAQLGENGVLFFFSPSWPDCELTEWDGWLAYHSRWIWAPLVLLFLGLFLPLLLRRKFEFLPVVSTAFLLFNLLQNTATMEGRYRKPIEAVVVLAVVSAFPTGRKRVQGDLLEVKKEGLSTNK
jgi:hypothetical protein